jgi:rhamnulokinase
MSSTVNFAAADLGASSGRLMLGRWDGSRFELEEAHRFANGGVTIADGLYWDVLGIWSELQHGLKRLSARTTGTLASIGVDGWGVDFALLDAQGKLIGNPRHYRDKRTAGVPGQVFQRVAEREVFARTGVASMAINTLFQLFAMHQSDDPQLAIAEKLLMIPDLFHYFLCGEKGVEYTEATTTQMYSPLEGAWRHDLLRALEVPARILPEVIAPGTNLGRARPAVVAESGFSRPFQVIAVASHDTASAFAATPGMDDCSVFLSCGTWSLMGVQIAEPNLSDMAFALGFTNEGTINGMTLLLKNMTGLWLIQQCQERWKKEGKNLSWEAVVANASAAEPFQLIVDPDAEEFLAPENMPEAIRHFCIASQQRAPETLGEMARCCFEGLSLKYRSVVEKLELLTGRHLGTIRIVGGGCHNDFLCQMTADVCRRDVVAGPAEASALGNLLVQAVATGHLKNIDEGRAAIAAASEMKTYTPHGNDGMEYAYSRFQLLDPAVTV